MMSQANEEHSSTTTPSTASTLNFRIHISLFRSLLLAFILLTDNFETSYIDIIFITKSVVFFNLIGVNITLVDTIDILFSYKQK